MPEKTTLIIPGFRDSGPDHWQTWFESQLPDARRVSGIDWDVPILTRWAEAISREVAQAPGPVWLVAHSFGCLASVRAAASDSGKIAGALLVAPADPERFSPFGHKAQQHSDSGFDTSIVPLLPQKSLGFPSALVASSNDPWMSTATALLWARRWSSHFINLGNAGHINADSGFGAWPQGLGYFYSLRLLSRGYARRRKVCGRT